MIIVHVLTRFLQAGSEENTLINCRAQVLAGHQVHLIFGNEVSSQLWQCAMRSGFITHQVSHLVHPVSVRKDLVACWKIGNLCKKIRPDIVHTHQSKAGILGRLGARLARVPVILHGVHIAPFQGVSGLRRIAYLGTERLAAFVTDGFIHVSEGMKDQYLSRGIGSAAQHHIIRSGMDLDRFRSAAPTDELTQIFGSGTGFVRSGPILLMVAAFEPRKKHFELIKSFQELLKQYPDAKLVLLGEGPNMPAVKMQVDQIGLSKSVYFAGFRDDAERWIAGADLCVLLSEREGLPRVIIQYLAAGKPVLCSNLPGLNEIVKHGTNGLIVSSISTNVCNAMCEMLDPAKQQKFAMSAKASDLDAWDQDRMCDDTIMLYGKYVRQKQGVKTGMRSGVQRT